MRQAGEPSVEEILESIKRVMERDNRDLSEFAPRRSAAIPLNAVSGDSNEDVLDLGVAGSPVAETGPVEEAGPVKATGPVEHIGPAEQTGTDTEHESLTTDEAANAMRQSLAALAMLSEPPAKPQIVRSGETSLEGMVREMLRPMMAQWLDTHLPEIVERMVKAEIARIAGKKR